MKSERYQNDRHFVWLFYLTPDRTPYDLTGLDLTLEVQVGLSKTRITDFTVSGNAVDFVFRGRDQKRPGPILATLYINRDQDGMVAIDAPAGLMSPHSTPGAPAPGGVDTSCGEIVSFLGEWVDDRLIPNTIARKSDLAEYVTKMVDDLVNYYTKAETYSRAEINALVGGIELIPVQELPEASAVTMGKVYLVPSEEPKVRNEKDEFVTERSGEEGHYTYKWEQIGSTAIDLSGYVTIQALNAALADYTTTSNLTVLLAGKQDAIADLQTIRSGASAGATAYQKPGTGIPKSDLDASAQASLGKADTALQEHQDLTPITELIPNQATPQNQLADKGFVNSSIATATATYRGSHNLVTDLGLATAATQVQIAAALATAVATADNNDYAFVQVPTADATPTEIARVDRYKYNGSAWAYEYTLNSSGFTAAQWAALNSAITSGLVAKLSDLPTYAELQQLLAGKQPLIDAQHKLDYDLLYNTPAPPSVPDISTDIEADKTSDTKTASPKAVHAVTGSLPSLNTTNKSSLVAAINEVASRGGEVEEAPNDGHMYARQSGSWARAEHLSERIVCLDFGVNEDTIGWLNAFGSAINIRRIGASNCATILISYGSVTQQAVTAGTVNLNVPVDSPVVIEITRTMASARAIVGIEFVITSNNS